MVNELGFASAAEAKTTRDEYFRAHHSTLKGLTVASREGRLPRPFREPTLGAYWAAHCEFERYLKPNAELAAVLRELRDDAGLRRVARLAARTRLLTRRRDVARARTSASVRRHCIATLRCNRLVVFTNGPRAYGLRCLEALGVREFFPDEQVFAVEDVMPACKPERAAFEAVLLRSRRACGDASGDGDAADDAVDPVVAAASRAVMFEDSMKNVRACKALGIRTVLIDETCGAAAPGGEAALLGDVANAADPAVDVVLQDISQLRGRIPSLWQRRFPMRTAASSTP